MLVGTMSVFTRELLDLLKDTPKCLLPFSQFIPSYHRKYGRQCRVSDYGYTKLLDLLESMPHILQVGGVKGKMNNSGSGKNNIIFFVFLVLSR